MKTPDLLDNQFNENLLAAFDAKIRAEIDAFSNECITSIDKIQEAFSDGQTKEAVTLIQKMPQVLNKQNAGRFLELVDEITTNIEEEVSVSKEPFHYIALEDDSGYIKTIKALKKAGRGVKGFFFSLRFIGKSEKPEYPFRHRIIPFKNVGRHVFYRRTKVWDQFLVTRNSFVFNFIHSLENELISQLIIPPDSESTVLTSVEKNRVALPDLLSSLANNLEEELVEAKAEWDHILPRVGTFELRRSRFNDDQLSRLNGIIRRTSTQIDEHWEPLIAEQASQIEVVYQLLELKQRISEKATDLANNFGSFVEECVSQPHQKVKTELDKWLRQLSKVKDDDVEKAFAVSDKNEGRIQDQISNRVITPIQEAVEKQTFSLSLNSFTAEIALLADRHRDRIKLISVEGFDDGLPDYEFKEINWQTFLRRMLGDLIASGMVPDLIKPEIQLQQLADDYVQLLQVVETNLDVAAEVEDKEDPESKEVLAKGIELSIKKMEDIQTKIDQVGQIIASPLENSQNAFFSRLYDLIYNQDVGEMKWADAQLKVKESAGNYGQRLSVLWAKALDKGEIGLRFVRGKFGQLNQSVRSMLGYSAAEHISVQKTNIARILHETDQTYKKLPFIYNRLFNFRREVESTFFIKNQQYFSSAKSALELWSTGFPASISIIGEKGSGKTTFIKHLSADVFKDEQVEYLDFETTNWKEEELLKILGGHFKVNNPESIQDIIDKINRRRKRTVIVVENIQNCFVRHINGYEAINALLFLISKTREKVLWVVSCSRYAWSFLNVVTKISDYFSHSVSVDAYSQQEIRQLILRRQQASGYQVVYRPDANTSKSRSYKKTLGDPDEEQAFLEDRFFEQLWKQAEGNSTAAMIYWIRSIVDFEESHFIIEPHKFSGIEYLQEMDSNSLFILAAFVIHDTLSAPELALVLRISNTSAQMQISRLQAQGLLVSKGDNFSLNDMVFRQVVRLLKSRNILNT